jgi:hypothetical protein
MCTWFWWESPKERDHSEDRGVDGRMVSEWILREIGWGVERIQLAEDTDRWRALVNTVMNLRVLAPRSLLVPCVLHSQHLILPDLIMLVAFGKRVELWLSQLYYSPCYFLFLASIHSPQRALYCRQITWTLPVTRGVNYILFSRGSLRDKLIAPVRFYTGDRDRFNCRCASTFVIKLINNKKVETC